jgi:hypothetical protein
VQGAGCRVQGAGCRVGTAAMRWSVTAERAFLNISILENESIGRISHGNIMIYKLGSMKFTIQHDLHL